MELFEKNKTQKLYELFPEVGVTIKTQDVLEKSGIKSHGVLRTLLTKFKQLPDNLKIVVISRKGVLRRIK